MYIIIIIIIIIVYLYYIIINKYLNWPAVQSSD